MAGKPHWSIKSNQNGIAIVELSSWKWFHDFIRKEMLDYSHFVWRGQHDANWKLQSSLDRVLQFKSISDRPLIAKGHLSKFRFAVRGRRGANPSSINSENDWWALGQHHGLATPLLDWTESPFVALYFAFENAIAPKSGWRAVWGLANVESKNEEIQTLQKENSRPNVLERVMPLQDDNARLVNQAGLFTHAPIGQTVEKWITENFAGREDVALLQLRIPNKKDRPDCLRTLNKMNINHVTLFPDLYGAGEHCNKALQMSNY